MSGVHRFLSKREKHRDGGKSHSSPPTDNHETTVGIDPDSYQDFYGLFFAAGKATSSEESKIKSIRKKIVAAKSALLKDAQILWALRSNYSNGDVNTAQDLLIVLSNASEGIVMPFDSKTHLLGAINRQKVTCYLDSTLFAMFSCLDSFEALLYNTFNDRPRNRLSFLLRVWVNLLRTGKLIPTDITTHIQEALAECGWEDASKVRQQDASEAFVFITEVLQLPLLTLKVDMFHAGKQDADDHKFVNERLLVVAIPANENGERKDVKLEDCLEDYFNNRIEVRRILERRSTISSTRSTDSASKQSLVHVEAVEVEPDSPMSPASPAASYVNLARPSLRARTPSIIQERFVPENAESQDEKSSARAVGRLRKGSVRKEVMMPAWQFFSLIPWYTDNAPSTDAQVADHFSTKRPVLGLCLKRYARLANGTTIRLNTSVDIPIEIGLPHFIQDDRRDDDGPIYGNFKLSLQSVVCHRGTSVQSGHYISLIREATTEDKRLTRWLRFDDLASERVTTIDIHKALQEETPYLLFYQIMPVDGDPGNLTSGEHPPSYAISQADSGVSGLSTPQDRRLSMIASEPPSGRPSLDLPSPDELRGRAQSGGRRPSAISFGDHFPIRSKADGENGEGEPHKSRSRSRASTALSKTLSGMTGGRSKEGSPVRPSGEPEVMVKVIEAQSRDSLPPAVDNSKSRRTSPDIARKDKGKGKHLISRSRHRSEHPDRECKVM